MRLQGWLAAARRDSSLPRNQSTGRTMPAIPNTKSGRVGRWLYDQPYLLLSLTSLFWAGNTVLGRFVVGHIPPMTLAFVRWVGAFLILLPFAARHLAADWPVIRKQAGLMALYALV